MKLEKLFDTYVESDEYSLLHSESKLPKMYLEMFDTLNSMMTDNQYRDIEDKITEIIYETEKFGFICGFKNLSFILKEARIC